jgi:ribose transport system permease protein
VGWLIQLFGLGTFFVIVMVFFSAYSPRFLTYSNTINILSNVAVIGIVSIGQTLAIISGGFDLSVSGTLPLAAVSFARLTNGGIDPIAAIFICVAIGALVGLINGVIITKAGINPLITTLGMLSITGGLAFTVTGGLTVTFENPEAGFLSDAWVGTIPNHVWELVILSSAFFFILRYTVFGRSIYAIGGNREASWLAGVRIDLITTFVYVISGALASFAGVVVASQLLAGSATVGTDALLLSIAAVILGGGSLGGGVGGIPGTLVGVLLLGALGNGLALLQVSVFYQQIATGGVLLLAVGFSRLRAIGGE